LGCTYQSLGYTYQALGYKMYGVEKTVSSASKHKIRKAFKIRLRLFLENLADYCEWHGAYCLALVDLVDAFVISFSVM